MTGKIIRGLLATLLICPALWATKAEREAKKLDKELRKISLTASVSDGRRVVNRVMAKQLGVNRKQLVAERRGTDFVYGQIFGAHEVARLAGMTFEDVARLMKQQKSLLDVSEEHRVDLKEIIDDAKKLNKKIDQELDLVANGDEDEQGEDTAEAYDPSDDSATADTTEFTPAERASADQRVHGRGGPLGAGAARDEGRGMGASSGMGGARGVGLGGGTGGGRGRGGPH